MPREIIENRRQIKVAFSGTSCAGKTSLVNEYRKRFAPDSDSVVVREAARDYFKRHLGIKDRFSVKVQGEIQQLAFTREIRALKAKRVTADRSVLDAPAYVFSQGDRAGAGRLLTRVRPWIASYSKIFLLDPADIPYKCDAQRLEPEEVRWGFHRAFLDFFEENEIHFELLSGTIGERLRRVDQVLEL
jgi:predicted ATPase